MTHDPSSPPPSATQPEEAADEVDTSFEQQLAGFMDYLKHATLAAAAAVAEGHPEQVLDLLGNLLTSYDKIRLHPPIVELQARRKAEDAQLREEAWAIAERELGFIERALKAGLTEDASFTLLERSFPPAPEPKEGEHPIMAALQPIIGLLQQSGARFSGGTGGGEGGKPCHPCERKMREAIEQAQRAQGFQPQTQAPTGPMFESLPDVDLNGLSGLSLTQQERSLGNLSQLASVASHYGASIIPSGMMGATMLQQMGVHTGSRLHSMVETAGLDPRLVSSPPFMPTPPAPMPSTDERWFGFALPDVNMLRARQRNHEVTVGGVMEHIALAMEALGRSQLTVPAFTELLLQERYADFVDVLLPEASPAFRLTLTNELAQVGALTRGRMNLQDEAVIQPPGEA